MTKPKPRDEVSFTVTEFNRGVPPRLIYDSGRRRRSGLLAWDALPKWLTVLAVVLAIAATLAYVS